LKHTGVASGGRELGTLLATSPSISLVLAKDAAILEHHETGKDEKASIITRQEADHGHPN
jgi:hypothetical protein